MESTQIMVGNFAWDVRAEQLSQYLETTVGLVDRCKVKRTHLNVPPHAFVQFASADVAKEACRLADRDRLVFQDRLLKVCMSSGGASHRRSKTGSIIELTEVQLQVGCLTSLQEFLVSWRCPPPGCTFQLDQHHRRLYFFFKYEKMGDNGDMCLPCEMKLELLLRDVRLVRKVQSPRGRISALVMILQLWAPPYINYRTAIDDIFCATQLPLPDDEDPWIRTVDFTPDKSIGRCLSYMLSVSPRQGSYFVKVLEYLKVYQSGDRISLGRVDLRLERNCNHQRGDFFLVPLRDGVPFDLMFLVNALVHRGIVNATSLTDEFYETIQSDFTFATYSLRHMLTYTHPVFNGVKRLQQVMEWTCKHDKLRQEVSVVPYGSMIVRRLIFTPTRAYCLPPELEMSNRVVRHFHKLSDRFLRVSFYDEDLQQMSAAALTVPVASIVRDLSSSVGSTRTDLYKRVLKILKQGFPLCGRNYSFLAFSANQLRDCSAWFFAANKYVNAPKIREWMGRFPTKNVAKYASRMGQCFSATFFTLKVPKKEVIDLPEIVRNGYTFSDGCGKMTSAFALQVAQSLKIGQEPPSAYQIRYAGYKGVVAVWPTETDVKWKLGLRNSMKKFLSEHSELEVVGWTQFLPCFLNRQIISLLSTLQVEDKVFELLQDAQVTRLEAVLNDPNLALEVLTTTCTGDLHSTAVSMLLGGFHPLTEPHLYDMLLSIRTCQLEDVVAKARIFVPQGRLLMGCLDETGLLQYGQCFIKVSGPSNSGCFQGDGFVEGQRTTSVQIVQGKVVMAKNPCLHPGDVRVLEAVDVPALHHMVDCLVVPQTGERPHPNEASGSDLDGDLYFTCWDKRLIPPSGSWVPMDYSPHESRDLNRPPRIEDVMEFFAKHMVNDSLGVICNAHVVHADKSPIGALDEDCLHLARLAAMAVDYPKTGKAAIMPSHLRPKQYPDFMEKDEALTYQSTKITGILYRKVKKIASKEVEQLQQAEQILSLEAIYDMDLQVIGYQDYLEDAWAAKCSYDKKLRGLMAHFNLQQEGDIVTGRLVPLSHRSSRRQGDLKERMKSAYIALRKEFRAVFVTGKLEVFHPPCTKMQTSQVLGGCKLDEVAPVGVDLAAKASAWYHVTYHPDWKQKAKSYEEPENVDSPTLLSFPWIAVDVLAGIKLGRSVTTRDA